MDLSIIIESCNDVDEFRTLLQEQDVWLNRKAAEYAFYLLRAQHKVPSDKEDVALCN